MVEAVEAEVAQKSEAQESQKSLSEQVSVTRPEVTKLRNRAAELRKRIGELYEETPKPAYGPAPDPQILEDLEGSCKDSEYW